MNEIVFDASAILALLNKESGYEVAEKYLPNGIISSVNLSEVISILLDAGISREEAENMMSELMKETVIFDTQQASVTASLRKITREYGLSLGDRACLALSVIKQLPVLTADKVWAKLNHSTQVILIR